LGLLSKSFYSQWQGVVFFLEGFWEMQSHQNLKNMPLIFKSLVY